MGEKRQLSAVRLIRHFVEFWDRTPMQEQTDIFGRRKYSGAPMDGKKEGDTADFAKDPDGKITPQRQPYAPCQSARSGVHEKTPALPPRLNYSRGLAANGQLDVGLVFICYQANLADGFIFVQNLLNGEPLEEYISPFGGGYFFVLPGVEKGSFLGKELLGV